MPWQELSNFQIRCCFARDVAQTKVVGNGVKIERRVQFGLSEKRFQFTGEKPTRTNLRVVERLHTHAIACEQQGTRSAVPECKSEHAIQFREQPRTILFVEMYEDFRIAFRRELVPSSDQPLSQLDIIKEFTVHDHTERFIFVVNGLVAAGEIDDRKAPHSHGQRTVDKKTVGIRSAMRLDVHHGLEILKPRELIQVENASNSAHAVGLYLLALISRFQPNSL